MKYHEWEQDTSVNLEQSAAHRREIRQVGWGGMGWGDEDRKEEEK